jgi:sugar phosphate permease
MWYIIRISFERVLRNIQKISFKDLGTMLYQGSIHYPVGKLVLNYKL